MDFNPRETLVSNYPEVDSSIVDEFLAVMAEKVWADEVELMEEFDKDLKNNLEN